MTALPLVQVPEERRQRELRHALERSGADPAARRRLRLLVLICLGWLFLGYSLLGLAFHLTDPDRAQAAFLAAILVANGGPAWTLVTAYWLAQQR